MSEEKTIHIFGATGSVGQNCVDVIAAHPEKFCVDVLTAQNSWEKLADIAKRLNARHVIIGNEEHYDALKSALSQTITEVSAGEKAIEQAAQISADISVMAIVGMAGIKPLLMALEHSKAVAIANKEPLVSAGSLVMERAKACGTTILPLDSEHNAIFQVFEKNNKDAIERLILTASGGPFREYSLDELKTVTLAQALKHPNWSMGPKITIDSATLVNKALEIIEAHYLFNMAGNKIDVLIHPQSVVHSMVEYNDGSVLAQLGASDMRTPITYVLGWPDRMLTPGQRLDFSAMNRLDFFKPDLNRFQALKMAYDCLDSGPAYCLALNAVNEVAVDAFLGEEIKFVDILVCSAHILDIVQNIDLNSLDDILALDADIRVRSREFIDNKIKTMVA